MDAGFDRDGPAVELEAVLHTEQLADVRRMLELRLHSIDAAALWRVITATNEMVANALVHAGRCLGLRVYLVDAASAVRVEVDDPSPVRLPHDPVGGGLGIVSSLTSEWGDQLSGPRAVTGQGGRSAAKTVWCEIAV